MNLKKNTAKPVFRKGVCGIFVSSKGKILLGERLKEKGQWQLPQGGIEGQETPLEALYREMDEEVGVTEFEVLRDSGEFISYHWPPVLFDDSKYAGQEHIYFLIDGHHIKPKRLKESEEFSRFAWFTVEEVLSEVIKWKLASYQEAFWRLGLLK
jgi:putative (di)nucleoside polyphosphate hydrolase